MNALNNNTVAIFPEFKTALNGAVFVRENGEISIPVVEPGRSTWCFVIKTPWSRLETMDLLLGTEKLSGTAQLFYIDSVREACDFAPLSEVTAEDLGYTA